MQTFWSAVLILAASTSCCLGDEKPVSPPGGIRLLEGYAHKPLQGSDTTRGEISRPGGLTIKYDIGRLAGNKAEQAAVEAERFWIKNRYSSKEQWIAGEKVQVTVGNRKVYVTFPKSHANFVAYIKSPAQLADVLLTVLTYRSKDRENLKSIEKKETPDPPPGEVRLLKGYAKRHLMGIDTKVGEITKKNGVTIRYDIGHLAGNKAKAETREAARVMIKKLDAFREQRVAGRTVQIAVFKRQVFVTFPKSFANFYADIQKPADMADVLLMVLTYTAKK